MSHSKAATHDNRAPLRDADTPRTPTASAPAARRRLRTWLTPTRRLIAAGSIIVVGALVILALFKSPTSSIPFAPNNPDANGTRAIAQILARQDVDIALVRNTQDALQALATAPGRTTLVIGEDFGITAQQVRDLHDQADKTVLFDPGDGLLTALAPDVKRTASTGTQTRIAACDQPDAQAADQIGPTTATLHSSSLDAITCFSDGTGAAMIQIGSVTVFASQQWLTNDHLAEYGNAALGLRTLGKTENLIWFIPDAVEMLDVTPGDEQSARSWIIPLFAALVCLIFAAGWWRGQRFGPLIAEPLPVAVHPAEVIQGRARLYRSAHDTAYAAALVRAGTLTRIATRLGIPPGTDPKTLVATISDATGRPQQSITDLCYGPAPANSHELSRLITQLDQLWKEVNQL